MRRSLLMGLTLLLTSSLAFAQAPARIQTPTRFVTIFSNLENQLMDALVRNDRAGAARMLTDDFAQWTPLPAEPPTPREEWLKPDRRDMANFRIRNMAVKDLGDHAAVSFVLTSGSKAWFIVDIWKKSGADWHLATRYLAAVDSAPFRGDVRPTGKN